MSLAMDFRMLIVMLFQSELLLDRLMLLCSETILQHLNICNVCSILSDATHFHASQLVGSLQGYMARNMETLLESRMLDDLSTALIKQLSMFVRARQAEKLPFTRSGQLIAEALKKHAAWLELQDIPQPIVRTAARGPLGRSPKLSPVNLGKLARRMSGARLPSPASPTINYQAAPSAAGGASGAGADEIFVMDDETIPPLDLAQPPPKEQTPGLASDRPTAPAATASPNFSPWKVKATKISERYDSVIFLSRALLTF